MTTRRQHLREIALVDKLEPLMHQTIQNYKGGSGSYILDGAQKIRLSTHAHQKLTSAGEVYWKQIKGEEPPKLYDYNQPLLQDKFIVARDGKKVQVRRRRADLTYQILPAGRAYFKHHKTLWVPLVPRLVVLYKGGKANTAAKTGEAYVHKSRISDYVAVASMPHLTTATMKKARGHDVETTEEEQRAEAIAQALAHIRTLPKMVVGGKTYYVLHHDSPVDHLFDPSEPILVSKQHTTFPDNGVPTVDTILARPLRGLSQDLPELLWRPFSCDADSFSNWQEACVIRMIHKSLTRRAWVGDSRDHTHRANATLPLLTVDVISAQMDLKLTALGMRLT